MNREEHYENMGDHHKSMLWVQYNARCERYKAEIIRYLDKRDSPATLNHVSRGAGVCEDWAQVLIKELIVEELVGEENGLFVSI